MKKLIFQHIPKAAGSTLQTLLVSRFPRDAIFNCGQDGVLNDFLALDPLRRDRLALLIGHVDYGIHTQFTIPAVYFAFVREPLERVLSHYSFIQRTTSHRYHQQAKQMDLVTFVRSGIRPRMNNCMTRMLSGLTGEYGKLPEQLLDQAIENLKKHYFFVGFAEEFDEGVIQLSKLLGWENPYYKTVNVAGNRPRLPDLSPEERATLIEYNELDLILYQRLRSDRALIENLAGNLTSR